MDDVRLKLTKGSTYITRSDIVFRNTASFLKTGRFLDADKRSGLGCDAAFGEAAQSSTACF